MPKGPQGQKRPVDAIGAAIAVAKIATGESEDDANFDALDETQGKIASKGGKARASKLTPNERRRIAARAAKARWDSRS